MQIGFVGLGTMGAPMAHNLLRERFGLNVFSRRPQVADEFRNAGATVCQTIAEVARQSDVVITIVTADAEVREVVLGEQGIAAGARPGLLWIDMSTISPDTTRAVAAALDERGVHSIDAPVSGGPGGAKAGTLAIMIGGANDDVARATGVLQCLGDRRFHVGPRGAGQAAKLVNQLLAGGIMTLIGEALTLGQKAGLDLAQLADVISASSGTSALFEARARKFVLADQFEPAFTTELMRKDVALALELADRHGVAAPVSAAALLQYSAAISIGQGDRDFASVVRVCQRASGVQSSTKSPPKLPSISAG